MKSFFYIKERKKGSHTITFSIYKVVKNEPTYLDQLKVDGRGYRGDIPSICRRLRELKVITKGELENYSGFSPSFNLYQIASWL